MNKVKEYAKSIATFLATIGINMVISLLQGEQPFPQTQEEWIRYLGTAFTAALATGVARNKMTPKQLDTAIVKGDLIPPVPSTQVPAGTTPAVWTPPGVPITGPMGSPVQSWASASTPSGNATVDDILAEYQAKHRAEQ